MALREGGERTRQHLVRRAPARTHSPGVLRRPSAHALGPTALRKRKISAPQKPPALGPMALREGGERTRQHSVRRTPGALAGGVPPAHSAGFARPTRRGFARRTAHSPEVHTAHSPEVHTAARAGRSHSPLAGSSHGTLAGRFTRRTRRKITRPTRRKVHTAHRADGSAGTRPPIGTSLLRGRADSYAQTPPSQRRLQRLGGPMALRAKTRARASVYALTCGA